MKKYWLWGVACVVAVGAGVFVGCCMERPKQYVLDGKYIVSAALHDVYPEVQFKYDLETGEKVGFRAYKELWCKLTRMSDGKESILWQTDVTLNSHMCFKEWDAECSEEYVVDWADKRYARDADALCYQMYLIEGVDDDDCHLFDECE